VIDAAVDAALAACEIPVTELALDNWREALGATFSMMDREVIACDGALLADPSDQAKLGPAVRTRMQDATEVTAAQGEQARLFQQAWKERLAELRQTAPVLVMATVPAFPTLVADGHGFGHTRCTAPFNLAGLPALALPVPVAPGSVEHRLPASLQLIGPPGGEELLLATAAIIEAAGGYHRG
jgi:amidase